MTRRSRTPRALAFAGLALCVLMLLAVLLNQWWDYYGVTDAVGSTIYISRGSLGVTWVEGQSWFSSGTRIIAYRYRPPNWSLNAWLNDPLWSGWKMWPAFDRSGKFRTATLPLWLPLTLIAAASGITFLRTRRRPPPGHCRTCGYNLTANTSGRCPECGTPVQSPA